MNQAFWEDTGQEDNKSAHRKNRTPEKVRFFRFSAEPFIWLLRPSWRTRMLGLPCAWDPSQDSGGWLRGRTRRDRRQTSEHYLLQIL